MELFSDIFYLLISSFENLSNWISRFPFAVKVTSTIDNKLKWSEKTLVDVANAKGTLRKVSPDLKRYHSINNFSKMNTYKIEKGAIIDHEKRYRGKKKTQTKRLFNLTHAKLPGLFLQTCSQPPFAVSHSFTSGINEENCQKIKIVTVHRYIDKATCLEIGLN